MNQYLFTGRLGRDQETRYTNSGMAICNFTVAVDYGYGDKKGTNWVRCALFGKRAEGKLPQYLIKGTQVAISGELQVREYDDKDGNKKTSVEVNVSTLDLIGSKPEQQSGFPSQGGQAKVKDPFQNAPDFGNTEIDDEFGF